jgi:hypothetical protein
MKDAFAEVESIWTRCIETGQKKFDNDILALLQDQGIRIRQDDGDLKQLTLSKPTSVNSGFVIGLRYIKKDGSHTEDLFSVEQGQQVKSYYTGSLEKQWPEYRGTHKQQIDFTIVANESAPITSVNTISMVKVS